jgi:hypothetical protein
MLNRVLATPHAEIADTIIGRLITLVLLKITWDPWRVITTTEPGELREPHRPDRSAQLSD